MAGRGSQGSALSSPQSGSDPAPGMAAMGPVSSSCFWQDGQGGPGEAEGQPPMQEGKLKEVIKQLGIKKSFIFSPLPLSSCFILYTSPHTHPLTHTYSGCGAGVQCNILAGAIAVPGRAAIRGTDDQAHFPKHQVDFRVGVGNVLHLSTLDGKGIFIFKLSICPFESQATL